MYQQYYGDSKKPSEFIHIQIEEVWVSRRRFWSIPSYARRVRLINCVRASLISTALIDAAR